MIQFLQVADPTTSKATSSWLKKIVGFGIKFLVGTDAFKRSWKSAPDARSAIALALGQTQEQVDAALRLQGKDPATYYDTVRRILGDNVENASEDDINQALDQANKEANDPAQTQWLWAAGGLLLLLGMRPRGRSRRTVVYRPHRKRRRRRGRRR